MTEPMSDERLAELREDGEDMGHLWNDESLSGAVLEIDRLRAELKELNKRRYDDRTDEP